jgi:hypothetical protein
MPRRLAVAASAEHQPLAVRIGVSVRRHRLAFNCVDFSVFGILVPGKFLSLKRDGASSMSARKAFWSQIGGFCWIPVVCLFLVCLILMGSVWRCQM